VFLFFLIRFALAERGDLRVPSRWTHDCSFSLQNLSPIFFRGTPTLLAEPSKSFGFETPFCWGEKPDCSGYFLFSRFVVPQHEIKFPFLTPPSPRSWGVGCWTNSLAVRFKSGSSPLPAFGLIPLPFSQTKKGVWLPFEAPQSPAIFSLIRGKVPRLFLRPLVPFPSSSTVSFDSARFFFRGMMLFFGHSRSWSIFA